MKDKCKDCKKEEDIRDLLQVKDQYPRMPKYKFVCEDCFEKKEYEYVGQLR